MSGHGYIYEFRTRRVRSSIARDIEPATVYSAVHVAKAVRFITGDDAREQFLAFMLDAKNKLLGWEVVAIGGLTGVDVHPRELFRPAIVAPAAAIVMAHNHPSGDRVPSPEDLELTRRMVRAGEILGIPVVDHVIVGEPLFTSVRERCPEIFDV